MTRDESNAAQEALLSLLNAHQGVSDAGCLPAGQWGTATRQAELAEPCACTVGQLIRISQAALLGRQLRW